jgi:6-pyruvoyltetrahydropterin/6-carboxytetrahydropterin synthase
VFTIRKTFEFSASHVLAGLPEGHQCGRLHGHNYVVELELQASVLDGTGFVLDYGELAPFKRWVDEHLDHRHLNDVFEVNPTAEAMAEFLHGLAIGVLPIEGTGIRVSAVAVRETPKTWAEYRPPVPTHLGHPVP